MERSFSALADEPFDLLVIGGGVQGAWAAYDAAQRGLRVACIEQGDWASSTSSASSKLVHGGLRYLENFEFGLVRRSLEERRTLAGIAPHRVRPLRFLIPVYRGARVGPWRFRAGLWLYDRLAGDGQPVDGHERLRAGEVLQRYPFVQGRGLRAGFTYGDCRTDDARLVVEVIDAALRAGAVCVNYARAVEWMREKGRSVGAVVEDRAAPGAAIEVRARQMIFAGGVWSGLLQKDFPRAVSLYRRTKGVHLILPALPTRDAMLLNARSDGRVFFILPWYGRTMVGTTDTDYEGETSDVHVEEADIEYLLEECNRALDGVSYRRDDLIGAFCGLRMLRQEEGKSPSSVSRDWTLESLDDGLLMPVGGKLTTARIDASILVDRVLERLGKDPTPCRTGVLPLPWAPRDSQHWTALLERAIGAGLDLECAETLVERFGSRVEDVVSRIETDAELALPIEPGLPFVRAELEICRQEMVVEEEDLLRRRIPLAILRSSSTSESPAKRQPTS